MVRKERLELSRLAALEPKSSASTNSATFALIKLNAVVKIITSPLPKPADFTPACLTSWCVFKGLSADIYGSVSIPDSSSRLSPRQFLIAYANGNHLFQGFKEAGLFMQSG